MCPLPEPGRRRALAIVAGAVAAVGSIATAPTARAADPAPAGAAYTTVVHAPGGPPQPVGSAVDGGQARQLAGTGGDPSLAARDLPGVARAAPGATGLVVWGAAPADSRVLFDGVEIPALTHFGGFRSTVGAELVGRVELVPGAYTAEYGRALGGLVRIDPRPLEPGGQRLVLDANLLDAGASFRGGAGPLRVAAAARASHLAETYGRVTPAATTSLSLFPIPRYADAELVATLAVGARASLRALVLTSFDRVRRELASDAPGLPARVEDQRLDWWRAAITYEERGPGDGLTATLSVGGDESGLDQRFGAVPASQAISGREIGLRARHRARLAPGLRLGAGLDALLRWARMRRAGSLTIPAREGDRAVFGQPPGDDVNADRWSATVGDLAPWVDVSFTRGDWSLTPGLRADAFPVDGSRALPPIGAAPVGGYARLAWALDPRLAVAYALAPGLIATVAGGLYHQPVEPADLSAVFGSPALLPGRALHATLSLWARLAAHTTLEATGFYRRLDRLPVRSPLAPPALAAALVSDGRGRSYGFDLWLRRDLPGGTQGWLTYTLGRSERWSADGPARLLDFDQTHVATAVASRAWGTWTFSGRARHATGMPRTPVVGSFFDLRDGVSQPLLGAQNSARLPAFFQLDARVERRLRAGRVDVTLYLDAQNLTGRHNAEEIVYTRSYAASAYLTGPPLLLLLGLRVES